MDKATILLKILTHPQITMEIMLGLHFLRAKLPYIILGTLTEERVLLGSGSLMICMIAIKSKVFR